MNTNINHYLPMIYKDDVKLALVEVNGSLSALTKEKIESTRLKTFTKMGVCFTSYNLLKKSSGGLNAFVASIGLSLICEELFQIVKLARKISSTNKDLKKVNQIGYSVNLAKIELKSKQKHQIDNKDAIEEHIGKVEKIVVDSKKILGNVNYKNKCNLALRITAIASLIIIGIGLFVITKPVFIAGMGYLFLSKPLILAGGISYLMTRILMDNSKLSNTDAKAIRKVDSEVGKMLEIMGCAKKINDGETGHFKPRFDDNQGNLKYYEYLHRIQSKTKEPIFNDDLEDSHIIINDNINYYAAMV